MEKQPEKMKVNRKLVIDDLGKHSPDSSPVRIVGSTAVLGVEWGSQQDITSVTSPTENSPSLRRAVTSGGQCQADKGRRAEYRPDRRRTTLSSKRAG